MLIVMKVDLFVNDKHEPAYIKVEDLSRDIAVGVLTRDWHTAPIEDRWFEVGEDWECNPELSDQYLEQLASWDLLQIFLPA
ncbi:hypothetical protein AK812_SmicGene1845 [Symbiodinium microadriaticum]|uniref:Uncharacterized protein n=1 Tax=Symbiodinium microadriaticum TaxID=2951 RepID=A0A1Q9F362_SYMMI|nr:hypothetical protein AK812_SmicGene1845 [Symbiodinium microadriaticum]